ncbi:MAG: reprolysin-like metallopeptidase, partial [Rhodanobacteraceae bacterium]
MSKRLLTAAMLLLAAIVLSASAATSTTSSSATPTLFSVRGAPQMLAGGAQKLYPVAIDENQAFTAIFKGGMWLPNPQGGREYAKYDHHLIHDNGDWTWVGKVPTTHGDQSVVITFGKNAVFGLIPQASGYPLRVTTAHGRTLLLQTAGDMLGRSPTALSLRANQDFKIPLRRMHSAAASSAASVTTQASSQQTASPTIDVMVAYTAGFVSEYGTVSAALTRIDNLVDVTNQAYVDSQVNQQIRLVHTVQV